MASHARLPRRLTAEREAVSVIGKGCAVVDIAKNAAYSIVIFSHGVAALVGDSEDRSLRVRDVDARLPRFALCVAASGAVSWAEKSDASHRYAPCRPPTPGDLRRGAAAVDETSGWRDVVVASIANYYGLQALEPSVRGFLAILEKQFDRSDAYVWELLQNGVDDGAEAVRVERLPRNGGLRVSHDGRPFSPLDVLGLSSVGLSTKSLLRDDGAGRSIGFMGIGFKAVYRRFRRVTVSDRVWRFRYEEPERLAPNEPRHAWVLQPRPLPPVEGARPWCAFELERPRDERGRSLDDDLRPPAVSAVALLGRAAISRRRAPRDEPWLLV